MQEYRDTDAGQQVATICLVTSQYVTHTSAQHYCVASTVRRHNTVCSMCVVISGYGGCLYKSFGLSHGVLQLFCLHKLERLCNQLL